MVEQGDRDGPTVVNDREVHHSVGTMPHTCTRTPPHTNTSHLRLLEERDLLVVEMVHLLEAPFGVLQKQLDGEEVREGNDDSD